MNEWLQRCIQMPFCWRAALSLLVSLLLLALGWLVLLLPQQQMQAGRQRQLIQQTQLEQQRLQQLAARVSISDLQLEINALQQPSLNRVPAQALENIVAARGTQLDAWQPESQPQQITLRLNWQQFTPLFVELADTTLPVPERFQLMAEQGVLMTQLWLEDGDEE